MIPMKTQRLRVGRQFLEGHTAAEEMDWFPMRGLLMPRRLGPKWGP